MVMYDNKLKTKENNIYTKDKIEPQFQSGEKGGVGRGGGGGGGGVLRIGVVVVTKKIKQ